ncbi:MAG: tetratricopeptide repeat protein, partial [Ktedonobacteraceae bacterium]|nr:tetratricopeptide repeat protein [Ktedonobacteraceae bacterium]
IKMRLYQKHFLLILDNFEQLAADPPSLIVDLLAFCPDLKVVVTSRIVLHLPGEHEFPVLPLKLPELEHLPEPDALTQFASIALFVQRAQAALPDFTVTPENAHTIAAICVRLDGLPLAIELAAARVKLLPPRALLQRLEKPWHLLTTAQPMADDRQQTLYNTIQWSYDLLNEQEQDLFQRLAVFAGGCTLETAEAFLENDQKQTIDILSLFGSLLDKSLIRRVAHDSEQPRFRMLETIREFGLDRLRTQGTLERYQSDHALYYLALLEEAEPHLKGEQQAYWLTCLEQELENLQAALRYAVLSRQTALSLRFCEIFGKFCGLRGYWNEEMRWLNAVLALSETPDSLAMRARILRRAGHLAYRLRDLTMARALQEESVALSREVGDTQNLAGALSGLGWTLYRQKDAAATAGLLQESVAAARESGDQWAIANTLESLGRFMYYQGQVDEAHQLLEESIVIARTLGDRESLARILTTAVSIAISQHRIEQASALAQEAFRLARELGAKPLIALVLDCRANIAMFQGEYQQAASLLDARVSLAQELHDQPTIAVKRLQLATIALVQEDLARATILVQESLTFFRNGKDHPNVASALHIFGNIKKARAEFAQAMELYKEALLLDLEVGNTRKIADHLIAMALVAFNQHRFDLAARLFGLAESSQQAGSVDIDPAQQKDYASTLPQVRDALGMQKFTAAWSQGYATTPEQIPTFLETMI